MPGIPQQRRAEHTAALYRSGDFIVERVASFIAEGLGLGEQVLVMCTIAHWNTIASRLESSGVVYGRATSDGRLVFVDAEEALDTITENGAASAARFGDMLQSLLTSTTKTRVYAEVVSLLAERGDIDAALDIERLGQQLAHTSGIQIFCGYHVDGAHTLGEALIARVRDVHDRSILQPARASAVSAEAAAAREEGHFHAVRFYQDRESLARIVGRFLGEGFVSGSPALVIATADHRAAIGRMLSEQFFDVARLERAGALIMVDADATLSAFMVDGIPDPGRFEDAVTPLLERACRGRKDLVVRAYGEMVDVLWKAGQTVAAVRLETLWNQLAQSQAFALLCGYSMGHFYKDAAQQTICAQHTHIISDSGDSATLH